MKTSFKRPLSGRETLPLLLAFGSLLTGCGSPAQRSAAPSATTIPIAPIAQPAPTTARQSQTGTVPGASATEMSVNMAPVLLWRPTRPARGTAAAPNPTFTSTAPTSATEGTTYTYNLVATDPANTAMSYSLAGPAGATITGSTLTWTPTAAQSRIPNQFTVAAMTAVGGFATQSFTITPAGTVRGTKIVTWANDSGETNVPADLSAVTINAWVPDGTGGYIQTAGAGDVNGNFSVPGVAAGRYVMQVGKDYLETTKSVTDFGSWAIGRPDRVKAASGTNLQFSFTNADPWNGGLLDFISPNLGVQTLPVSTFTTGSTTLASTQSWVVVPLFDGAKGDQMFVTETQPQVTQVQNANSINYVLQVLTSLAGPFSFTMTNGITNTLNGAFTSVGKGSPVRFNFHATAFHNLAAAANPNAVDPGAGDFASISLFPYDTKYGYLGPAIDLVTYGGDNGSLNDSDFGDVAVGNPLPNWKPIATFDSSRLLAYVLPASAYGGAGHPFAFAHVNTSTNTLPAAGSPLEPLVGNVLSPAINGANFFSDLAGITTTPTISWTAPSVGTPTFYRVTVTLLIQSSYAVRATFYTTNTSIKLPPSGVFISGVTGTPYYSISITAVYRNGIDGTVSPLRGALPSAEAPILSGMVTP